MNGTLRRYIMALRIKELTEVLDRMGMRKVGRKAELQERVASVFAVDASRCARPAALPDLRPPPPLPPLHPQQQWQQRQQQRQQQQAQQQQQQQHMHARVAMAKRYVEEAYCRMVGCPYTPADATPTAGGAGGAAPPAPAAAAAAAVTPPGGGTQHAPKRQRVGGAAAAGVDGGDDLLALAFDELIGAASGGTSIRCLCGSGVERGAMVQCDAPQCHVWQHSDCVAAPPAPAGLGPAPPHFCERCRVARADPFWEVYDATIFAALRVQPTGRSVQQGTQVTPICSTGERSFYVSPQQLDLVRSRGPEFRLQVVAVQLDDANAFRQPVRVYGRGSNYKLGPNQRDDAVDVSRLVVQGRNTLLFSCQDARPFALSLVMVRQRSMQQVKVRSPPPPKPPPAGRLGMVSMWYAMREALAIVGEEGLEAMWDRHMQAHQALWEGLRPLGLEPFVADERERLITVNTIKVPEGADFAALSALAMSKYALEISGGLGPSAGKVWRVGLMGANAHPANVQLVVAAFREGLAAQGLRPDAAAHTQKGDGAAAATAVKSA
ncbi:hypothetical protein Rsub_05803 [Raphidocelis subcapitata]|uniref:SAP domain-containing protein n=1 Tax=Raphidocelis subcapitata TaxID=307507 RepID=A0A2V0P700_9CHLO|nr:hypothetical protein Rsub_05803 [Raphidocelis subcapitata]|eukprot:GBF92967.1 hypothetical protein Rsub_05803 [Raphidocelis subcapitata]